MKIEKLILILRAAHEMGATGDVYISHDVCTLPLQEGELEPEWLVDLAKLNVHPGLDGYMSFFL